MYIQTRKLSIVILLLGLHNGIDDSGEYFQPEQPDFPYSSFRFLGKLTITRIKLPKTFLFHDIFSCFFFFLFLPLVLNLTWDKGLPHLL